MQQLQGCGVDADLPPAVSHQKKKQNNPRIKKDPNNHSPKPFQSFGEGREAHCTLARISEFSVTFHGGRDGSITTLSLWCWENASADPPVFQHMNFNIVCLPYLLIF